MNDVNSECLCAHDAGVDTQIRISLPKKGEESLVTRVTGDSKSDKCFKTGEVE